MTIRNVVFDVGGVLLEWDPPSVIARLYPDAGTQAVIRQQMFEHPDWHEFDRGTLSYDGAIEHFARTTGRSTDETRALIRARLDEPAYAAACERGRVLAPEGAVARALETLESATNPTRAGTR